MSLDERRRALERRIRQGDPAAQVELDRIEDRLHGETPQQLFHSPATLWRFLHGGGTGFNDPMPLPINAIFTVHNTETGNRFTYRVRRGMNPRTLNLYDSAAVQLLKGSDNTKDYVIIGALTNMLNPRNLSLDSATRWGSDLAQAFKTFKYFYEKCRANEPWPKHVDVWHEGRCGRCGRRLTVPESIKSGIGPECANKIQEAAGQTGNPLDQDLDDEFTKKFGR